MTVGIEMYNTGYAQTTVGFVRDHIESALRVVKEAQEKYQEQVYEEILENRNSRWFRFRLPGQKPLTLGMLKERGLLRPEEEHELRFYDPLFQNTRRELEELYRAIDQLEDDTLILVSISMLASLGTGQ